MGQENKTKQESKGEKKGYSTSKKVNQIIRQNTDIAEGIKSIFQSQEETSAEAMKIDDFAILQKEWECTLPESEARRTVENQINKIVKKTNNFTILQEYWKITSLGSKPRELIEKRMS
nr:hypothetical protein [Patescibacteria group bacterium]